MDFLDVLGRLPRSSRDLGTLTSGSGGERPPPRGNNDGQRFQPETFESYETQQSFESYETQQLASQREAQRQFEQNARSQGAALPPPASSATASSVAGAAAVGAAVAPAGGGVVWGSFERNTGTWCPYPDPEKIEAAYARGDGSIFLPECFNATLHFDRTPPQRPGHVVHHHQKTAAVGAKPAGFRSVLRGRL